MPAGSAAASAVFGAAAQLPIPSHSASEARRAAREILARGEYREPARPLLDRARDALFEFLGRLLARMFEGATASPLTLAVVAVVVLALVALVVRFLRGITRDPAREATVVSVTRRTATDWRAEADAFELAGDWHAALRCRYRALVADLAERGLVDEIPGRTTGEYRREVADSAPSVAGAFDGASTLFELAWYGNAATGPDEASRFRDLESRVLAGAT